MSRRWLSIAGTVLLAGMAAAAELPTALLAHVEAHRDGRAPWSIDFAALKRDPGSLPIGVFDSGIGGLTVLDALLRLDEFNNDTLAPGPDGRPDFAGEQFIYFGDQANLPYGNYPAEGGEAFLHELILKDVLFLLGTRWRSMPGGPPRFDKRPVKAIVIACNTATAYGLEDVRAALRRWEIDVPVIGVVEAGANALARALPDDNTPRAVAVLATVGTCSSQAYPKAIDRAAGRAGKTRPVVVQQGSVGLAGAIEGNAGFIIDSGSAAGRAVPYQGPSSGNAQAPLDPAMWPAYQFAPKGLLSDAPGPQLNSVPNYARYDVISLLEAHRRSGGPPISAAVLGCTHFPLATAELAEAFRQARAYVAPDGSRPYAAAAAAEVQFIDPASSVARDLFRELARSRLRRRSGSGAPSAQLFFSVPATNAPGIRLAADGSLEPRYKFSRQPGKLEVEDTVAVPLTARTLPPESARLVSRLPAVWRELKAGPQTNASK